MEYVSSAGEREPGAPQVKDVQINGSSSQTIGPFTAAGTFKFYCTIHPGTSPAGDHSKV